MSTVLIAADICPIGENLPLLERGDARGLFQDLLPEFEQADLVVANLECPLVDRPSPIRKTGPNFRAPGASIKGIQQAGIDVLALANNHILDQGAAGLRNTLEVCASAGIATVGAGENLGGARRILIKMAGSVRVGILAVAEHEFSIATDNSAGANPLDWIDLVRNVTENQSRFDHLIILLHGGDEFHVPSPRIQNTCRFMIEMGASAVIVQHPHILGGYETYHGGHIVYGQGALIMDEAIYRNRRSFHEGFLVKLVLDKTASASMDIIPFTQSDPRPGARRMPPETERPFRQALEKRSKAILDPAFVEAEWLRFCDQHKHGYLSALLGHNRLLAKLNTRGFVQRFLYGHLPLLRAKNVVCCENHREALETIFNHDLLK